VQVQDTVAERQGGVAHHRSQPHAQRVQSAGQSDTEQAVARGDRVGLRHQGAGGQHDAAAVAKCGALHARGRAPQSQSAGVEEGGCQEEGRRTRPQEEAGGRQETQGGARRQGKFG